MNRHVYLDETKAKSYVLAAVSVDGRHVEELRQRIRILILPGQTSLHMRSESERRRKQILSIALQLVHDYALDVSLYDAGVSDSELVRRNRCLRAIVAANAADRQIQLIFDRDETLVRSDRQTLIEAIREAKLSDHVRYSHVGRRQDQLLAMPDVFAWCWNRGGPWRKAVQGHLSGVHSLRR